MPHDLLDRAFVSRLRIADEPMAREPAAAAPIDMPATPSAITKANAEPGATPASVAPPNTLVEPSVLERLLEVAPAEWASVADAVERAIVDRDPSGGGSDRAGLVVAAVARRSGDGCSTFVEGLAATLRARGIEALETTADDIDPDATAIQIVDAGTWFGSGPIRRDRARALAERCDAVILLRRADRSTAAAFARAVEVAGVRVLGEVTTFGREPVIAPGAAA